VLFFGSWRTVTIVELVDGKVLRQPAYIAAPFSMDMVTYEYFLR
jgi:hypothetical protein